MPMKHDCTLNECLDLDEMHVLRFVFYPLFFFPARVSALGDKSTVHALLSTVHALFTDYKILKMGPTVLFTHFKIILLQCFQFSVSTKNKLYPNGSLGVRSS